MADTPAVQNPQTIFDEAVKLLAQGKFDEGAQQLQTLSAQGITSADLEANLGHALVETGKIGPGVSHLMNAVALDRFSLQNRHDLKLAQSRVDNGFGLPMAHPSEWGNTLASFARPLELAALSSLVALALIAASLLTQLKRRAMVSLVSIFVVSLALAVFSTTGRSIATLTSDAELKSAPLESSDSLMSLKNGTRVRILRRSGQFAEVERANAFRGWVSQDTVTPTPF